MQMIDFIQWLFGGGHYVFLIAHSTKDSFFDGAHEALFEKLPDLVSPDWLIQYLNKNRKYCLCRWDIRSSESCAVERR